MEFTEEIIAKLTKVYIGTARAHEIAWMMTMTNLMNEINLEKDIDVNGEDDCVVEMKLMLPKRVLAGYLRAMDKTTRDIEEILAKGKNLAGTPSRDAFIQKTNGALFIAGILKLTHDNAKNMVKFIMKSGVELDRKDP